MPQATEGRYRFVRWMAQGEVVQVYLARDLLLDRPVAVKVLGREGVADQAVADRFRREAQALARLSHPNVVRVYDWGADEEGPFLVMEHLPGRTLAEVLASEGSLPAGRAAAIGADVAAGLAGAHHQGVVHGNLNISDVLVPVEGPVKVAGFGLGHPGETPGAAPAPRGDLRALGGVLRAMVAGAPAVPAPYDAIAARALGEDPPNRYQDADEAQADLAALASAILAEEAPQPAPPTVDQAPPADPDARATATRRRRGLPAKVYLVVFVLLLIAVGVEAYFVVTTLHRRRPGAMGETPAASVWTAGAPPPGPRPPVG
ncbi:MAG TPA: serine/threonine-protein kinase [Acidimicrobiales bacterium]|nr:serine/threonine-protein kinase [Acidimicrobiales bacterium]